MTDSLFGRQKRDPELREALRRLELDPSRAEDDALRTRITQAAASTLRDRRRLAPDSGRRWWEWTSSWARLALPAGAAVVLVSALLLARMGAPASTEMATDTVAASSYLVGAPTNQSGGALLDQVLGPTEQDWLFSEAMVSARSE